MTEKEQARRGQCWFCIRDNVINLNRLNPDDPPIPMPDPSEYGRNKKEIAKDETIQQTSTFTDDSKAPGATNSGGASSANESTVIAVFGADERTSLTFKFPEKIDPRMEQHLSELFTQVLTVSGKLIVFGPNFRDTMSHLKQVLDQL
jgi:hypothetical protein